MKNRLHGDLQPYHRFMAMCSEITGQPEYSSLTLGACMAAQMFLDAAVASPEWAQRWHDYFVSVGCVEPEDTRSLLLGMTP